MSSRGERQKENTPAWEEGWDRIFGKKEEKDDAPGAPEKAEPKPPLGQEPE